VEEKTPGIGEDWCMKDESEEDPPLMTVNTHPRTPMTAPGNTHRLRGDREPQQGKS
jgi:hypothetical protein